MKFNTRIYFSCAILYLSVYSGVIGLLCGHCDDVTNPKECNVNATCGSDRVCGINQFMTSTSNEIRYRLTCMTKTLCAMLSPDQSNNLCVACCETDECNKHLCSHNSVTTTTSQLKSTTLPATTTPSTLPTTPIPTTPPTTPIPTTPPTTPIPTTLPTTPIPTTPPTTTTPTTIPTTPIPKPHVVVSKSQIVLDAAHMSDHVTCTAHNADVLKVYENEMIIKTIQRGSLSDIQSRLVVNQWKNTTYRCEGINSHTHETSTETVTVTTSGLPGTRPSFPLLEEHEIFGHDGDHIGLTCIPEGNPTPSVTWTLPNPTLMNTQQILFHYDNVELEIKSMAPDLAGTYTCTAHNSNGNQKTAYHVRYLGSTVTTTVATVSPPLLIKPDVFLDRSINVTEGQVTVAIPCAADGIPAPSITWQMAQDEMPPNVQQYENYLIIHNVGFHDSRYYICTATNTAGATQKAILVLVIPKPHIPPKVTVTSNLEVKYGEQVVLACQATGYPSPNITWSFNGQLIGTTPELHIPHAALTDIGAYSCLAINDAGKDEKTVILMVTGTAPLLTASQPSTILVDHTHTAVMTCRATGEPTPSITWSFKSFTGTSDSIHQSLSPDNTTLTLSHVDKSGTATCTASNPFGQVQSSFSVVSIGRAIFGR